MLGLFLSGITLAPAQQTPPSGSPATDESYRRGDIQTGEAGRDWGNFGWIGLIGLAGLFGLAGRRSVRSDVSNINTRRAA
jgi:MYXO-CTERM domain-containing protein